MREGKSSSDLNKFGGQFHDAMMLDVIKSERDNLPIRDKGKCSAAGRVNYMKAHVVAFGVETQVLGLRRPIDGLELIRRLVALNDYFLTATDYDPYDRSTVWRLICFLSSKKLARLKARKYKNDPILVQWDCYVCVKRAYQKYITQ